MINLEVCVDSYESAIIAEEAGATRIELCSALGLGGLTPSFALLSQLKQALSIPVFVMIRPRSGNFFFSSYEFETMKEEVKLACLLNADGIVTGVVTQDAAVDIKRTTTLFNLAGERGKTFHRAFDITEDPYVALEDVIRCGASRLLTSGLEATAPEGLSLISELHKQADKRIRIMVGSGVNSSNILLFKKIGIEEFHLSGRVAVEERVRYENKRVHLGQACGEKKCCNYIVASKKIKEASEVIQKFDIQ